MPLANLNDSGPIHNSLRELLKTLPSETDKYTIDFKYYGMSLEQVQSYSIYSLTILSVFVGLNSITIGAIIAIGIWRRKRKLLSNPGTINQNRFEGLRDSLRSRGSDVRSIIKRKFFKRNITEY